MPVEPWVAHCCKVHAHWEGVIDWLYLDITWPFRPRLFMCLYVHATGESEVAWRLQAEERIGTAYWIDGRAASILWCSTVHLSVQSFKAWKGCRCLSLVICFDSYWHHFRAASASVIDGMLSPPKSGASFMINVVPSSLPHVLCMS